MSHLLHHVAVLSFAITLGTSCIESPQTEVNYSAVAIGGESTATVGEWSITLTRADLAFGPVYFCAASSGSSTLCSTSIAELTRISRIDGLSALPISLGTVHGFSGAIRSATYDLGISWFDTTNEPRAAAEAPSGHSAVIEGEAKRGTETIPFVANIDVVPQFQGQRAIPTAPVAADVESSNYRLEISFNAASWLRQLDFNAIAVSGSRPFVIEPGSPEHNAILVGIKNLSPPEFRWVATSP